MARNIKSFPFSYQYMIKAVELLMGSSQSTSHNIFYTTTLVSCTPSRWRNLHFIDLHKITQTLTGLVALFDGSRNGILVEVCALIITTGR
jgi:hypothetical protein